MTQTLLLSIGGFSGLSVLLLDHLNRRQKQQYQKQIEDLPQEKFGFIDLETGERVEAHEDTFSGMMRN